MPPQRRNFSLNYNDCCLKFISINRFLNGRGKLRPSTFIRGSFRVGLIALKFFSATLEHLFHHLRERWREEFPDELNAWCYVDDCVIVFASWACLIKALPWLLDKFAQFGLSWNVRKTKVCASTHLLRQGRELLPSMPDLIQKCQWGDSFKYLGMQLSIPAICSDEGANMTDILMAQCKHRVLAGVASLRLILRKCHFLRWKTALQLLDVFVGPEWLWMSPCMHPTITRLKDMQSLQLGVIANTLQLYVPDWMKPEQKRALHRIRRRACLELLRTRSPGSSWVASWVRRKWTYMGHVMRRDVNHPPRQLLF